MRLEIEECLILETVLDQLVRSSKGTVYLAGHGKVIDYRGHASLDLSGADGARAEKLLEKVRAEKRERFREANSKFPQPQPLSRFEENARMNRAEKEKPMVSKLKKKATKKSKGKASKKKTAKKKK